MYTSYTSHVSVQRNQILENAMYARMVVIKILNSFNCIWFCNVKFKINFLIVYVTQAYYWCTQLRKL